MEDVMRAFGIDPEKGLAGEDVIVYADASVEDGHFGLGVVVEWTERNHFIPFRKAGRAEKGNGAEPYEKDAIEFAAEICGRLKISKTVIYSDNKHAVACANSNGYQVRWTKEKDVPVSAIAYHLFAHEEAVKGRREATA